MALNLKNAFESTFRSNYRFEDFLALDQLGQTGQRTFTRHPKSLNRLNQTPHSCAHQHAPLKNILKVV